MFEYLNLSKLCQVLQIEILEFWLKNCRLSRNREIAFCPVGHFIHFILSHPVYSATTATMISCKRVTFGSKKRTRNNLVRSIYFVHNFVLTPRAELHITTIVYFSLI